MTSTSSSKKKSFQISCNIVVLEEEEKAPHKLIYLREPNERVYGSKRNDIWQLPLTKLQGEQLYCIILI